MFLKQLFHAMVMREFGLEYVMTRNKQQKFLYSEVSALLFQEAASPHGTL